MTSSTRNTIRELRSLIEQDDGLVQPPTAACPPGFTFDGKSCVPMDKNGQPPKPGTRPDMQGDLPNIRHQPASKEVPLAPDPKSEVMQEPHNAIVYSNGMRTFEYAAQEWTEYAHNSNTLARFPDAYDKQDDFIAEYLHGENTLVTDWSNVENTDASDIKPGDTKALYKILFKYKGEEVAAQPPAAPPPTNGAPAPSEGSPTPPPAPQAPAQSPQASVPGPKREAAGDIEHLSDDELIAKFNREKAEKNQPPPDMNAQDPNQPQQDQADSQNQVAQDEQESGMDPAFEAYVNGLVQQASEEQPETAPPIIVGHNKEPNSGKETYWLVAGNSRAMCYAYLGKPAPVRLIPLKGRMLPEPTDAEKQQLLSAEQSSPNPAEVEQNLRTAIQQMLDARAQGANPNAPPTVVAPPAPGPQNAPQGVPIQGPQAGPQQSSRDVPNGMLLDEGLRSRFMGFLRNIATKVTNRIPGVAPIGTKRKWSRGEVQKTSQGWVDLKKTPAPNQFASDKKSEGWVDTTHQAHKPAPVDAPVTVKSVVTKTPEKPLDKPSATVVPVATAVKPKASPKAPTAEKKVATPTPQNPAFAWSDKTFGASPDTFSDPKHYSGYNKPTPERQALHDAVIATHFDHVPATPEGKKPVAILMMGGPASGKTGIATAFPSSKFVHLDSDQMKESIPEYKEAIKSGSKNAASMVHKESVHMYQQLRAKALESRKNMVMAGTGQHLDSYMGQIDKLRQKGYHVKVILADTDREIALKRAKTRGELTGRHVPEHIFDQAYYAVPRNFQHIANAADEFEVWDTRKEGSAPELKWEKTKGKEVAHDPKFVEDFKKKYGVSKELLLPSAGPSTHLKPVGDVQTPMAPPKPVVLGRADGSTPGLRSWDQWSNDDKKDAQDKMRSKWQKGSSKKDSKKGPKEECIASMPGLGAPAPVMIMKLVFAPDDRKPGVDTRAHHAKVKGAFHKVHKSQKSLKGAFKHGEGVMMVPAHDSETIGSEIIDPLSNPHGTTIENGGFQSADNQAMGEDVHKSLTVKKFGNNHYQKHGQKWRKLGQLNAPKVKF